MPKKLTDKEITVRTDAWCDKCICQDCDNLLSCEHECNPGKGDERTCFITGCTGYWKERE